VKAAILLLAAVLLNGCASIRRDVLAVIPDGRWKKIDGTITGKFSSTTIHGVDVVKEADKLMAGSLSIRHSNAWVPLIQLTLEVQPATPAGY